MTEEHMNIADYGLMIINQIDHKYDLNDPLSNIKALIYAGMIKYYGQEKENKIYIDFLKTSFVAIDKPIVEFLMDKYNLERESAHKIASHEPGTLLDAVIYKEDNITRIERTIYFERNLLDNPTTLIESLTHQMNHIINSTSNSITEAKKTRDKLSRMGISYDSYERGRKIKSLPLEEAINKLQTKEIIHEIKKINIENIKTESIKELLNDLINLPVKENKKTTTEQLAEEIYKIPELKKTLNKGRLSGHFKDFYEEINSRTKYIKYPIILSSFDNLESNDEEQASVCKENIKTLIKTYEEK